MKNLWSAWLNRFLWLEELAAPYHEFKSHGFEIDIASPLGGEPPVDPKSLTSLSAIFTTYLRDREISKKLHHTLSLATVEQMGMQYDAYYVVGGHGIMWKAGHSLLKAKMRETGALLGGEMSGHLFFADRYFGFDDGIYAGARMIEILAKSGAGLARMLSDLPNAVFTPEIRVPCPDEQKFVLAEAAQKRFRELGHDIVDVDGVRVIFENGWGLIRASNTQPILVLRFEATDEVSLARYRRLVEGELEKLREALGSGQD